MKNLEEQAIEFIDKKWPENRLALGVKEQWAEMIAAFADAKLQDIERAKADLEARGHKNIRVFEAEQDYPKKEGPKFHK